MASVRRPFDAGYPHYNSTQNASTTTYSKQFFTNSKRAVSGWFDETFFIFAGIASIWLAVVALIDASTHSWWGIPLALIFWIICAYLTLPRFHRIITALYVPDYFIGRTRTGDGLLGDPVNIGILGESVDIQQAMENSGWHRAEAVTLASSWRIITKTLRRKPYATAPVSPLYLFNRKEDFAYQQEVDGSPSKRHHVRFWKTPQGWVLPGGTRVDWLAAATFDRAVGLSLFTMQVTHKIEANTDLERDYVINTVKYCNPTAAKTSLIKDFSSGYESRNGGGDSIITDGHLPILDIHDVVKEQQEIPDDHRCSVYSHHRSPHELAEQTPLSVWIASLCVGILALLQLGLALMHLDSYILEGQEMIDDSASGIIKALTDYSGFISLAILILIALTQVILALSVIRGRSRSRKILLILLSFSFVVNAFTVFTGNAEYGTIYAVYVLMAVHVFALLAFTSDGAVNYTHNRLEKLKEAKA